jgi:hypothetical protein
MYLGKIPAFFFLKFWCFATKNRYGDKKYLKTLKESLFFKDMITLSILSLPQLFIGCYVTMKAPIFTTIGEFLS